MHTRTALAAAVVAALAPLTGHVRAQTPPPTR